MPTIVAKVLVEILINHWLVNSQKVKRFKEKFGFMLKRVTIHMWILLWCHWIFTNWFYQLDIYQVSVFFPYHSVFRIKCVWGGGMCGHTCCTDLCAYTVVRATCQGSYSITSTLSLREGVAHWTWACHFLMNYDGWSASPQNPSVSSSLRWLSDRNTCGCGQRFNIGAGDLNSDPQLTQRVLLPSEPSLQTAWSSPLSPSLSLCLPWDSVLVWRNGVFLCCPGWP